MWHHFYGFFLDISTSGACAALRAFRITTGRTINNPWAVIVPSRGNAVSSFISANITSTFTHSGFCTCRVLSSYPGCICMVVLLAQMKSIRGGIVSITCIRKDFQIVVTSTQFAQTIACCQLIARDVEHVTNFRYSITGVKIGFPVG